VSAVFDHYSRYYDLLYRDKDYAGEAAYVAACLGRHAPHPARILELGCGTGAHAEPLARLGFSVDGVDRSETMLARAAARKAGLPSALSERLSFEPGDVRHVRTGRHYDAVISLFHVVSYQVTDADLQATFATAAAHLRPGGLFFFDFWYGPAVLAQRPEERVKVLEDDRIRVTRNARPVMHEKDHVVDVNYAIEIASKSSAEVQRVQETHRMRYLFLPELARLQGAAFRTLASHAWLLDEPPSAASWAACQILVRADLPD